MIGGRDNCFAKDCSFYREIKYPNITYLWTTIKAKIYAFGPHQLGAIIKLSLYYESII